MNGNGQNRQNRGDNNINFRKVYDVVTGGTGEGLYRLLENYSRQHRELPSKNKVHFALSRVRQYIELLDKLKDKNYNEEDIKKSKLKMVIEFYYISKKDNKIGNKRLFNFLAGKIDSIEWNDKKEWEKIKMFLEAVVAISK